MDGELILYPGIQDVLDDLTHRRPIYPDALVVYCAEAGFDEATVMFRKGSGDLAKHRWSEGKYAVIAGKASQQ